MRAEAARNIEGNEVQLARSLGTLDGMEPDCESLRDLRKLESRIRDPEFRARWERLHAEMFERLAPPTEGPVVNPGRKRRGRLVFGDASE